MPSAPESSPAQHPASSASDETAANRVAGLAAVAAALSWTAWAVANTVLHRALEGVGPDATASTAHLGALLTAGWNLLLIPAALRLHQMQSPRSPALLPFFTVAGLLSLSLWALGGLTHITPELEIAYLALASIWLVGLGSLLRRDNRPLGTFTIAVGVLNAFDVAYCLSEPAPPILYFLSAPKLPASALWSLSIGVWLLRRRRQAR